MDGPALAAALAPHAARARQLAVAVGDGGTLLCQFVAPAAGAARGARAGVGALAAALPDDLWPPATPADAAPVVRAAADPGAPALVRAVAGVHPRRAARGAGVALDEALVRRALHEVEGACVRGGGALSRSPWAVVVLDCRTAPRARAASKRPRPCAA